LFAFVSDIHGNLEALNAVVKHMESMGVSKVFSLGDVVGYGPNPVECIEIVKGFELSIKGNHEAALLFYPSDFNPQARMAIEWTRDQLNVPNRPREEKFALWEWIDRLPEIVREGRFMLAHGSPRDPVREYILPQNVHDRMLMEDVFSHMDRGICLVGHSHVPGVYTEKLSYMHPDELEDGFVVPKDSKAVVNVGSVGQPRDNDPRACYVTWDRDMIRYHRVEYDFKTTMDKITETGVLPEILALRLESGR